MVSQLLSAPRRLFMVLAPLAVMIGMGAVSLPSRSEQICTINQQQESCQAGLEQQVLSLRRSDGSMIRTRPLGRCPSAFPSNGREIRCNVRISLPDDFVYGLQVLHPDGHVEVTAPILTIRVDGLLDAMP